METFRFLHCADLHLDSPLRGLEADPDAPADTIRGATREAFRALVSFAVAEKVDFVVAAGDLYDGDWQDWRTGHFLTGQVNRLEQAGIPFVAIRGNHDAASVITRHLRHSWLLNEKKPETRRLENLPVSIHGQSFATAAVTDNLARAYPPPEPGRFNIGLLHSSVGEREGHDTYASCSVDQLHAFGYDYWALGHIHKQEILARDPWVVFPGNTQGRHIKETGPKGAMLVTVTDLRVTDIQPIPFDTVRWARVEITLGREETEDDALTHVRAALAREMEQAGERLLAARVILSGATAAHHALTRDLSATREKIKAEAIAAGGHGAIWIEAVRVETGPPPVAVTDTGAVGRLLRALEEIDDAEILDTIATYANTMLEKGNHLKTALGSDHPATNQEALKDLIARARAMLPGALTE
jgi:DNA repair protein SbcD/Mre11